MIFSTICISDHRAFFSLSDQNTTVTVAITDRCGGCKGATDLDFSKGAFDKLTNSQEALGRVQIEWQWA